MAENNLSSVIRNVIHNNVNVWNYKSELKAFVRITTL